MTYESLMPDEAAGYSQQPVELFGVAPPGKLVDDLFQRDPEHADYLTLAAMDVYSDRRYEIYWGEHNEVRRRGDDSTLRSISQSPGRALVMPFRERLCFAVLGDASGFVARRSVLVDHCTPGVKSGCEWRQGIWDHWPIGWLNSQEAHRKADSPYPYSFGSIGQFFVPEGRSYTSFVDDYFGYAKDVKLNHWTERGVFYVLIGAARDWSDIRRIGRSWLAQGERCAKPESIADLK
jgi:hypothetical protein